MDMLIDCLQKIHIDCHILCKLSVGKYLPVVGNIAIFTQSEDDYNQLLDYKIQLTKLSENFNQKYFELIEPLKIAQLDDLPEAIYTHLYIRKPDPTPYGKYLGDVDFVVDDEDYENYKAVVLNGRAGEGIEIYDRPGWDTIQISNPNISSVAYISTKGFAEKVRIKFD